MSDVQHRQTNFGFEIQISSNRSSGSELNRKRGCVIVTVSNGSSRFFCPQRETNENLPTDAIVTCTIPPHEVV